MFCENCGHPIPDGSRFCEYCGARVIENSESETVITGRKVTENIYLCPDGKYRWIGTCMKPNISELAYFLGKVYNYKHTIYGNDGEAFPEESLNKLFGVTRLYSSLTQVYNAKRKQRWRSMIDTLFE